MNGGRLGTDFLSTYEEGIKREWIIGNGLGGYASSTAIGAGTRTYHGLLVAASEDPAGRFLLLSSLDEEIYTSRKIYRLATHKYQDAIFPTGFNYLSEFNHDPFPFWVYQPGNFSLKKEVFMPYKSNTTCILYEVGSGEKGAMIRIYPLLHSRDFNSAAHSGSISFSQNASPAGAEIESSDGHLFSLRSNLDYHADPKWHNNLEYDLEKQRGNFREDNFNPGYFEGELKKGTSRYYIAVSTEDISSFTLENLDELYAREKNRQDLLVLNSRLSEPFALKLLKASDIFIVKHSSIGENTIIAGYHWYSDWGRDAMISLPGLLLVPRRFEEARSVLENFIRHSRNGLLPNNYPFFGGDPVYNTVDASLWFIYALDRYFTYTQDFPFLSHAWDTVNNIIENYRKGTDFGIGMDSDYLIQQGSRLTWMDGKVGEWAVTPRAGKACEINALWYNALKTASHQGTLLGRDTSSYDTLAPLAASNFENAFWNPGENCLFDLIYNDENGDKIKDPSIRPNQIFAVSLPYTILPPDREKAIVDRVEKDLLTPFGLKSLSSDHYLYLGRYSGDAINRDPSYHNGTIWPWLLGAYVKAYLKVHKRSKNSLDSMRALLEGFDTHLEIAGLGTVSEVFDGDYPHSPGGAIAQAWSVAEILRAYVEDVLDINP